MKADNENINVAICITTRQRPKSLTDLLEGIRSVQTDQNTKFQVIIIDNDEQESAKDVYEAYKSYFPVLYVNEKRRGIPFARNKALDLTLNKFEYITFIDDDEIPSQEWLIELFHTQKRYQADVVMGPALPLFAPDAPSWIKKGKFFEKKKFGEGHELSNGSTCNVLIKTEALQKNNLKFEESMALMGGTDALFFQIMKNQGSKIVWSDKAVVYEQIPNSRANAAWILKRAYRFGNSLSIIDLKTGASLKKVIVRLCKGLGYIGLGFVKLLLTFYLGKKHVVISLQMIMRGMGNITGLLNINYEEYKTIHKV